jgi:Flp pilus assembly secretin CpaC
MIRQGACAVIAAIFAAAFALPASAAEFKVALDQARALTLPGPASGVVIGNPSIAGVSVQNDRLLFVTGRSYGTTNLIVVGAGGAPIFQGRITVTADESDAVIMHRGAKVVRYDCTPECRRRPDLSEDMEAFRAATGQIEARKGLASGE